MTDSEIRAAQERAERATKGRWECVDGNSPHPDWAAYVVDDSPSDWDFVRNARTDIPALCRDLLAAREALEDIRFRASIGGTHLNPIFKQIWERTQAALAVGKEGV